MTLPNTLLLTYQAEYETTPDMTIDDICTKYDVQTKQLKGYTKWQKRILEDSSSTHEPTEAEDFDVSIVPSVPKKPNHDLAIPKDREELLTDIDNFKGLAIAHAVKFMKDDAEFAEVKEFKDMVAIVDSIEKSYRDVKDPSGTTINIAIQNLVERFSDDC